MKALPKVCKHNGCNSKAHAKGYCNRHYKQWRQGKLEKPQEEEESLPKHFVHPNRKYERLVNGWFSMVIK